MRRVLLVGLAMAAAIGAQQQPFTFDAMVKLARLSDPQVSPDGTMVAFTLQRSDLPANKNGRQIWVLPLSGGAPRQITTAGDRNEHARWSPDGKQLVFISDRGGSRQVWMMDADGASPRQVTNLASEADGVLFTGDGKSLLFTSAVYPECGADDPCNKKKIDATANDKVKARTYTNLLFRHWNQWDNARRRHLLVVAREGGGPKDLTPGDRDVPPFSLGSQDYDVSPDGQEVCYSVNTEPVLATSTNSDLFVVSIAGGQSRRIVATPGADASPHYSPDGKYIGWRAQFRAGYESDRWRLQVLERATGRVTNLTETLDRWVTGFTWSPDSSRLFFTTEDRGRQAIQFISVNGGEVRTAASGDNQLDDMQFTRDGKTMVYTQQSGSSPVEIFRASSSGGAAVALTHLNDAVLSEHPTMPMEDFWVEGSEGARIHTFLVKPPGFQADRRYPVLMLIHGGPQGAWGQEWTYRWNAQVFAAAGYVVLLPNPRGSTGYGQKFVDDINGNWGGRPFDDLMAVADHVIANLPYVDGGRMAAAGGSYGGFMASWILGHSQRFKALVSHAGVFDLRSMFASTEELWFPLWEFGGTPWDNPDVYQRWSPSFYVKDFHTPTLVIHGELDFRVPYDQGLQLYTALQMQKVPSKLLLYPDEGHWILKPQNSMLWYKTVIEWIDNWIRKS